MVFNNRQDPCSTKLNFTRFTRSQAEHGNADPEALPPIFMESLRGRASVNGFPGRAWKPVNFHVLGVLHIRSFRVPQVVGLLRQIRRIVQLS